MSFNTEAIETRYKSLLSINNKFERYKKFMSAPFIIMFVGMFSIPAIFSKSEIYLPYLMISLMIAVVISMILIGRKQNKYVMKRDDYVFFTFYNVYDKMKAFSYSKTNENFNSVMKSIKKLSDYVGQWAPKAPEVISKLPNSINQNLISKLAPLIKEEYERGGQIQTIGALNQAMMNMIYSISSAGLTLQALQRLDELLVSLPESKMTLTVQKEPIYLKYPILKFMIPPICGIILFYVFNSADPTHLQTTLGFTLSISTAVLLAVIQLSRNNKRN